MSREHPVAVALRSTRALIDLGWTQHTAAIDQEGNPCNPADQRARAWCISGALGIASMDARTNHHARRTFQEMVQAGIESWNDQPGRTKQQVLMACESAAIMAEDLAPMEELCEPSPSTVFFAAVAGGYSLYAKLTNVTTTEAPPVLVPA